jgi:hypothetical protein
MLDPAVEILLVAAAALLFGSAAVHKARAPAKFAAALEAYRLLPRQLLAPATLLVPLAEMAAALGMLWRLTRPAAAVLGAMLLATYAAGIAINLRRGRRDIDCGCAGFGQRRAIAPWMVWRNLALALCLLFLLLPRGSRALTWSDAWTIAAALAAGTLLYLAADLLLGQLAPRAAGWRVRG